MRPKKQLTPGSGSDDKIDDRVERSKKAVLLATYELITEVGLSGVSVDEVTRRSGVAKTTIYRHWSSREAIVFDACKQLSNKPELPNTGSLRHDLEILATGLVGFLTQQFSTILPSLIDAAERDENLAQLQAQIHREMRASMLTVIQRGQQDGQIDKKHDSQEIVAGIFGPLLYRRYFSREQLDHAFALKVVDRALSSVQ